MLKGWDPVVRIVLAQMYRIEGWTEDAIYSLAHRDEPLEVQDFDTVGLGMAIGIVKLREIVLKHPDRWVLLHLAYGVHLCHSPGCSTGLPSG